MEQMLLVQPVLQLHLVVETAVVVTPLVETELLDPLLGEVVVVLLKTTQLEEVVVAVQLVE
jgi:hypothetical protein